LVELSKKIDGKKFLWDGIIYKEKAEAKKTEKSYKKDGFETKILKESSQFLVYTRRVVTEIEVKDQS
jgi:hypothetical protein